MNEKNMTFEASMQRLEQIVRIMERGDAQLDESFVCPELFEACDLPAGPNGEPRYKFHRFY